MSEKCFCHLNGIAVKDATARKITDNFVTPKMFGAVGNGVADDTEAIRKALNSFSPCVVFGMGKYRITSKISATNGNVKFVDGSGCTILTGDIGSGTAFEFRKAVSIENINFDCQNKGLTCAIGMYNDENTDEVAQIHNITIKNLKDTNTATSSQLISVSGFVVDISECHMSDCYKVVNSVVGDGGGNLTGIFAGMGTRSASGRIYNCSFKNMSNIDASGNLAYEDVSCVYVGNMRKLADGEVAPEGSNVDELGYIVADESTTSFTIENINGINYGKRLIKTQTSNIVIRNVNAYADDEHDDSLSAVGVGGPGKNAVIEGVTVTGKCLVAIATSVRNTIVSNCILSAIGRTDIPTYGGVNTGVLVVKDATIRDCIFSKSAIAVTTENRGENIAISGCVWEQMEYTNGNNPTMFLYASDNQILKNITISNCKLSGYSILTVYENSEGNSDGVVFENNVIYCKKREGSYFDRFYLVGCKNLVFRNNEFFDEYGGIEQTCSNTCIFLNKCENVYIEGVTAQDPVAPTINNAVVKLQNCTGNNVIKGISAVGYQYITSCSTVDNLNVEITEPAKQYFGSCTNVKTNLFVINTEADMPGGYGIAEGMTFYIIETKKFKRRTNGAFVDI